jgi:predicted Zn-dependent protease with MMP-like domain
MRIPEDQFMVWVNEALDAIPAEFKPYLENLEIEVEDWPSRRLLRSLGIPRDEGLYGLYTGTALPDRSFQEPEGPSRITLYRGALLEDFPEPGELKREIAVTVLHEVAHHLGIGEERLEELGLD